MDTRGKTIKAVADIYLLAYEDTENQTSSTWGWKPSSTESSGWDAGGIWRPRGTRGYSLSSTMLEMWTKVDFCRQQRKIIPPLEILESSKFELPTFQRWHWWQVRRSRLQTLFTVCMNIVVHVEKSQKVTNLSDLFDSPSGKCWHSRKYSQFYSNRKPLLSWSWQSWQVVRKNIGY